MCRSTHSVVISDFDDEITTLPVRPAPSSSDRILALSGYPLDSGDDSSDEDLIVMEYLVNISKRHAFWSLNENILQIRNSDNQNAVSIKEDMAINSRKYTIKNSFTLGSTEEADKVKILQSCNGLLLCTGSLRHAFDYVYNSSTNLLKILPEPDYANVDSNVYGCAGLRLVLDPTITLLQSGACWTHIAMYWNNALHWLETENSQLTYYKLNIEYPDHPIITIIQIPQSLQQGRNLFKSYGNILPMIITIQIPHILHLEGKLLDSHGCLLLVRRDYFGSSEFTIYEMMKGSSVWSVRYHVDTDDFMTLLPEGWSIRSTVWSIVFEEREDDSFFVINLSGKVVEYNLISKNLREMYDMGSNQLTNDHGGFILPGFIPPFAMYDMRPKQVDHKVYKFIPLYASV
ncbi:hypothetical protein Tco_0004377 [Tanacetum coccineum]